MLRSSAVRARQTLGLLKLGNQLDPDHVKIPDRFYNAGGDTLIDAFRELLRTIRSPCSLDTHRMHQAWYTN